MPRKIPQRDAVAAFQRKAKATRRVGENAQCSICGEKRPEALIPKSNPMVCAECQRQLSGKNPMDYHHIAGGANSPITISIPANDHRAGLSVAQYDWPEKTLQNPSGCPLRRGAACVRGFADTIVYLMEQFLLWVAEMLERLSAHLEERWGSQWWIETNLQEFAPKGKSNEAR